MGQTLTNGIFLPNEGERNCYTGLAGNWRAIDGYIGDYNVHVADAVIHVSQADRDKWDAVDDKADASALTAHTGDTTIHVTAGDKSKWNEVTSKANDADVLHKSGDEAKTGKLTVTELNTTKINNLNPGALSLPNLSTGVDISGYLTNAGTTTPSEYTPTVDGWLVLAISADSPAYIRVFSTGGIDTTAYSERNELGSTSGGTYTRYAALTVPCRQNDKQNIIIMPGSMGIVKAMYYPCMGNV